MYKKINNPNESENRQQILRKVDNATIPFDESNSDYQEYLKWVAEGNTPEPADE